MKEMVSMRGRHNLGQLWTWITMRGRMIATAVTFSSMIGNDIAGQNAVIDAVNGKPDDLR